MWDSERRRNQSMKDKSSWQDIDQEKEAWIWKAKKSWSSCWKTMWLQAPRMRRPFLLLWAMLQILVSCVGSWHAWAGGHCTHSGRGRSPHLVGHGDRRTMIQDERGENEWKNCIVQKCVYSIINVIWRMMVSLWKDCKSMFIGWSVSSFSHKTAAV